MVNRLAEGFWWIYFVHCRWRRWRGSSLYFVFCLSQVLARLWCSTT